MFLVKTIEIRSDVPALLFWLLSLFFFLSGIRDHGRHCGNERRKWFFLSGLMIASAILTTQKAIFAAVGLLVSWICILFDSKERGLLKERRAMTLWFCLGFLIPLSIVCLYFLINKALGDFIYRNFIMNIFWKERFLPFHEIKRLVKQNPSFSVLSFLGLITATFQLFKAKRKMPNGLFVPILASYFLLIGLFVIPVPHRQYYLLFLPLWAIYCGFMFDKLINYLSWKQFRGLWAERKYMNFGLRLFSVLILVMIFGFIIKHNGLFTIKILAISHFFLWIWLLLLPFLMWAYIRDKRRFVALLLLICIVMRPFIYTVRQFMDNKLQFRHSNESQLEAITFILKNSNAQDTILDGWSGLGVFRNHAYYYCYLHGEIQAMLTPQEISENIIKALRSKTPKFIMYDEYIFLLPRDVTRYIEKNYESTGVGPIYVFKNVPN
jgi:hypothetical protein